jgi:hypothetical protein
VLALATIASAASSPEITKALDSATYVYVQSERKSGEMSKPAEIWFFVDEGVVYVGTRPTSYRVKRIKAGRTKARIAVGSADGPSFDATGAIVNDKALQEKMMAAYAKKYPEGWAKFAESFRKGFETGDRVLVAYTPR